MRPEDRKALKQMSKAEAIKAFCAAEEKHLQKQIAQELNRREIYFVQARMDRRTTTETGTPDFICCAQGRFLALEAKSGTGVQSLQQKLIEARIDAAGGQYYVVRSLVEVIGILKSLEVK